MKKWGAVLVVAGVALWSVWPVIQNQKVIPDYGSDGMLITWIMSNMREKVMGLFRGGKPSFETLFDANILYPYKNVLAYSDLHTISSFLGYSRALIVGQVAVMVIIFLGLGKGWNGAIGAVAFGLSQIRWEYQVHVQMWSMQYMLVAVWLIVHGLKEQRSRYLYEGAVILGLQVWESLLPIYFAGVIMGTWYLVYKPRLVVKPLIIAGAIWGTIAYLPLSAYAMVGAEFNYRRDIREAAHNSIGLDELWKHWWSPGLFILLIVAALRLRGQFLGEKKLKFLVALIFAGLIMAMGPVVKWDGKTVKVLGRYPIPLPYTAAYYTVPGFGALRTPSRWLWVAGLGMAGVIGEGVKGRRLGLVACLGVAILGGTHLIKYREIPSWDTAPSVYKWLGEQPGKVIAELPMGEEMVEGERMIYSLDHRKQMVGGYTGFMPPARAELEKKLNSEFPSEETINLLKELKVDYVIVSRDWNVGEGLNIIWEDEKNSVVGL